MHFLFHKTPDTIPTPTNNSQLRSLLPLHLHFIDALGRLAEHE
jgi:hypothetical protein